MPNMISDKQFVKIHQKFAEHINALREPKLFIKSISGDAYTRLVRLASSALPSSYGPDVSEERLNNMTEELQARGWRWSFKGNTAHDVLERDPRYSGGIEQEYVQVGEPTITIEAQHAYKQIAFIFTGPNLYGCVLALFDYVCFLEGRDIKG